MCKMVFPPTRLSHLSYILPTYEHINSTFSLSNILMTPTVCTLTTSPNGQASLPKFTKLALAKQALAKQTAQGFNSKFEGNPLCLAAACHGFLFRIFFSGGSLWEICLLLLGLFFFFANGNSTTTSVTTVLTVFSQLRLCQDLLRGNHMIGDCIL